MCGRCMKTCPWNLEGLFAEAPFRWMASNIPSAAPLACPKLDDAVGNGGSERHQEMVVGPRDWKRTAATVRREIQLIAANLQRDLDLKYEDQTLAVYPANLAPHPWPYPFPMDREKGIEAYQAMVTAEEYKARLERGRRQPCPPLHRCRARALCCGSSFPRPKKMTAGCDEIRVQARSTGPTCRNGRPGRISTSWSRRNILQAIPRCPAIRRTGRNTRSACCAEDAGQRRLEAAAPDLHRGAQDIHLAADQPFPAGRDGERRPS